MRKICNIQDNLVTCVTLLLKIQSRSTVSAILSTYAPWLLTHRPLPRTANGSQVKQFSPEVVYGSHGGSLFLAGIEFEAQDLSSFPQEFSWTHRIWVRTDELRGFRSCPQMDGQSDATMYSLLHNATRLIIITEVKKVTCNFRLLKFSSFFFEWDCVQ